MTYIKNLDIEVDQSDSPDKVLRTLAERAIVPKVIYILLFFLYHSILIFSWKDWDQNDEWVKDKVLDKGSAVAEVGLLYDYEIEWAKEYNTRWYRSKDVKGGKNPFASYMINKKWILEEEFNNHILRFQQVKVSSIFSH